MLHDDDIGTAPVYIYILYIMYDLILGVPV